MQKVLIFYSDFEIVNNSTKSIPRLLAGTIHNLENEFSITYFTFSSCHTDDLILTKPINIIISSINRLQQKFRNQFLKKKIDTFTLKKNALIKFINQTNQLFDVIIAPNLEDISLLRLRFPESIIIYWIHGISAIYKPAYLKNLNAADVIWSPTITVYKKIIEQMHPVAYTGQFQLVPNWAHEDFIATDKEYIKGLRSLNHISDTTKIFIFCGGDKKIKGWYLMKSVFKLLKSDAEIVIILTGSTAKKDEFIHEKIRVIHTGLLEPQTLSAYYRLAEFGLFPSLGGYEHAPLTLIEMITCKVIPIASNVGGIEEMLGADYPFLIAAPHAVKEWVRSIEKILGYNNTDKDKLHTFLNERMQLYTPVNPVSLLKEILHS